MFSKRPEGPRSLDRLLKQAEKATQVRRAGTEQVLAELQALRETTREPELQSALAWLCNALTRLASGSSTAANSREVLLATHAVKRAAG
ncbi:hypothetical protein [Mycobacterium rhizamassiliense]|uniref:hypothetical protein n=1 Tax=Mycobacterium rhizamassiliense TaxID=1841860 RepID=UPI001FE81B66|nr:hypothetical protein [Mycobacterium rhizamassiliense]